MSTNTTTRRAWSREEDNYLKQGLANGLSPSKIAKDLGRTVPAVRTRIWLKKVARPSGPAPFTERPAPYVPAPGGPSLYISIIAMAVSVIALTISLL
jgi:hypothetical protein